jgi:hypothetical protein
MKYKLLTLALSTFLAQSAFAVTTQDQPNSCPSLSAIKATGIHHAAHDGFWYAYDKGQYDTSITWTYFEILNNRFNNESEALLRANADLDVLTLAGGPEQTDKEKNQWACFYSAPEANKPGVVKFAAAVTPPFIENVRSIISKYRR